MSSSTTRVSLYKPAGGENVNVTTDLNNNYDKIDTNLNFRVAATQTARFAISPYWEGLNVRDTDTGRTWVSNGSSPQSGSWSEILNSTGTFGSNVNIASGKQFNVGGSASSAAFAASMSASGMDTYSSRVSGDTQSRFLIKSEGVHWWGPGGSTAIDTNLYRDSASVLATDDEFLIKGGNLILSSGGTAEINTWPSASNTYNTSTSEAVIGSLVIPANDMIAGAMYRLVIFGTINTTTGPPSLTIRGRFGGLAGTQFATTGTIAQVASMTTKCYKIETYVVCLTTGGSGSVFGQMDVWNGATVNAANPVNFGSASNNGHIMDGSTPVTVDTTASLTVAITAQWSASSASNSIVTRGVHAMRVA